MTCAACATRIEKGLNKMDGVTSANVNLALENATVEFNPTQVTISDLIGKVEKLGYGAHIKENDKETIDYRKKQSKNKLENLSSQRFFRYHFYGRWSDTFHSHRSFMYQNFSMNPWVQLLLATPVQFIIGWGFYVSAFKALRNKSANMDVLVVLGTSAAYFYSVYEAIMASGEHQIRNFILKQVLY